MYLPYNSIDWSLRPFIVCFSIKLRVWLFHWLSMASLHCMCGPGPLSRLRGQCLQMNYLRRGRRGLGERHWALSWREPDTLTWLATGRGCCEAAPGAWRTSQWPGTHVNTQTRVSKSNRVKLNKLAKKMFATYLELYRKLNVVSYWGPNCRIMSNFI